MLYQQQLQAFAVATGKVLLMFVSILAVNSMVIMEED
jgi:hypothetical protein